ncbi:LOW QUALITY PROTEIN: hypothetical protein QYF61_001756 [Mycteria americana]|uniref:Reverse transcriptase domain-containing protein n=1 Tax=Mycteria americana TaxID=33587 RepID=A0AAN7PDJ3_MYCAM|nr:LOW QUALITY PROTEIN: hypothetical protein QYF61_001756 [Mycteria americana]
MIAPANIMGITEDCTGMKLVGGEDEESKDEENSGLIRNLSQGLVRRFYVNKTKHEQVQLPSLPPIFKNGKKKDLGIYSLTSVPGKVIEQLVLETISRHMKDKKIVRSSQHGFTKGKSCLTNLVTFYDEIPSLVGESSEYCLYLNFSDSFNTVSRKILIEKLLIHRLDEQTLEAGDQQYQGSLLGAVLFSIFINDLDDGAERTLSKFTQDVKLGGVADTPKAHAAIDRLEKWADRNLMVFSKENCEILHLGEEQPQTPIDARGPINWKAALQKRA